MKNTTKKVLIDSYVVIEFNERYWHAHSAEERAKMLQREADDVERFLKDHRSMDIHHVRVVKEYETQCKFCGYAYTNDDKNNPPYCCTPAQSVWAGNQEEMQMEGPACCLRCDKMPSRCECKEGWPLMADSVVTEHYRMGLNPNMGRVTPATKILRG